MPNKKKNVPAKKAKKKNPSVAVAQHTPAPEPEKPLVAEVTEFADRVPFAAQGTTELTAEEIKANESSESLASSTNADQAAQAHIDKFDDDDEPAPAPKEDDEDDGQGSVLPLGGGN